MRETIVQKENLMSSVSQDTLDITSWLTGFVLEQTSLIQHGIMLVTVA